MSEHVLRAGPADARGSRSVNVVTPVFAFFGRFRFRGDARPPTEFFAANGASDRELAELGRRQDRTELLRPSQLDLGPWWGRP